MAFDPLRPPPGQRYLFHYTDCESAESIAEDEVCPVWNHGMYTSGLYATDLPPVDDYLEDVPSVCFGGCPPDMISGVVVIALDDDDDFFEEMAPAVHKRQCSVGGRVELYGRIAAVGCFDGEQWTFTASYYD